MYVRTFRFVSKKEKIFHVRGVLLLDEESKGILRYLYASASRTKSCFPLRFSNGTSHSPTSIQHSQSQDRSLYLSVETRRMQPLKERFSSGAALFRYLPAPSGTHFPLSGELTGPRLIQDIVSTLLRAILREAARYVIYRSWPHELPSRGVRRSCAGNCRPGSKRPVTNQFLLLSNTFAFPLRLRRDVARSRSFPRSILYLPARKQRVVMKLCSIRASQSAMIKGESDLIERV